MLKKRVIIEYLKLCAVLKEETIRETTIPEPRIRSATSVS